MGEIITYQLVDEKGKVILSGTYKEYFKKLSKLKIREKGYLYYTGKDGYIWAAPMKSNTNGKKHRTNWQQRIEILNIDQHGRLTG